MAYDENKQRPEYKFIVFSNGYVHCLDHRGSAKKEMCGPKEQIFDRIRREQPDFPWLSCAIEHK